MSPQQYSPVPQISVTDEFGKSEEQRLYEFEDPLSESSYENHQLSGKRHSDDGGFPLKRALTVIFGLITALSVIMSALLFLQLHRTLRENEQLKFENEKLKLQGFSTDVQSARQALAPMKEVQFTGALKYNLATKEVFRDVDPDEPQYFGDPRVDPNIDDAWKRLLRGEFFQLSEEEAAPFRPHIFDWFGHNKSYAELDVFHSLHCLNAVRIHLDKDYYMEHGGMHQDGPEWPTGWSRAHLDHCLDQIRQSIQCSSDLTPVPLYLADFMVNRSKPLLGHGHVHTCRDFESIRKWYDQRNSKFPPLSEFN